MNDGLTSDDFRAKLFPDRERRERARRTAGSAHARISVRGLLGEIAGAWHRLAGGRHNADERPRHCLVVEAHAAHEHAVRRADRCRRW